MIKNSADLIAKANSEIITINIDEAKNLYENENVIFVDLRDIRELEKEGKIKGAIHAPRGMLEFWIDPSSTYHHKIFAQNKRFVFFCAAAWRSALATKMAKDMGMKNICHMEGGFDAWKKAGYEIEQSAPLANDNSQADNINQTLNRLGFDARLGNQIAFILEIDKLKQIFRQTPLLDYSRKENDAEHSWQLAMMAFVLIDHAPKGANILRVLKMVLIHDIVEIDAGDNPAYSNVTKQEQHTKEIKAAERLFSLLPKDLAKEFRSLWDEFEEIKTPDALFARAMDRLQPFLHNYFTDGKMWLKHEITYQQVIDRMIIVEQGAPKLYKLIEDLTKDAVKNGYLNP